MTLPLTISGISVAVAPVGPFKAPNDAYYFFGRDGTTATTLQAFKSTAPDTSWSSIATKTGFTTAILNLAACQSGNVIHILVQDGTASTSLATKYISFDTSNDTFLTTTETVSAAVAVTGQVAGVGASASLIVRSNGEVVAFYNGLQTKTSGTFRARVYYRRRTAVNTWSTETQVDANAALDNTSPIVVLGAADRCHFLFNNSSSTIQRHLTSANVLGTAATLTGAGIPTLDAATIVDGANIRHVTMSAAGGSYFTSADNPTAFASSGVTTGTPSRLVDDNAIVNALYRNAADSDLYIKSSSDFGSNYGTGTNVFTGTVAGVDTNLSKNQTAYQRGSNVVFPYIVNDNGTLKYNEYFIRTVVTNYTMPAATGVVVLAGPANTLAYQRTPMPAVTGAATFSLKPAGLARSFSPLTASAGAFTASLQAANLVYVPAAAPPAVQVSWAEISGVEEAEPFVGILTDKGTVTLAGQVTALRSTRKLPVANNAFLFSGKDATLAKTAAYKLTAVTGSVSFSSLTVNLKRNYALIAACGAFTLTGYASTLATTGSYRLTAGAQAFACAYQPAALRSAHVLSVTAGAFNASFKTANLVYTVSSATVQVSWVEISGVEAVAPFVGILAGTGALAFARVAANLRTIRKLQVNVGAFALSGKVTGLLRVRKLTAVTGAFALSGVAINLRCTRKFIASVGTFTLTGLPANFAGGRRFSAEVGTLLLTGNDTGLVYTSLSGIIAYPGTFVLSGQDVEFDVQRLPPLPAFVRFVRPVIHTARRW